MGCSKPVTYIACVLFLVPTLVCAMEFKTDRQIGKTYEGSASSYLIHGSLTKEELGSLTFIVEMDDSFADEVFIDHIDVTTFQEKEPVVTVYRVGSETHPITHKKGRYEINLQSVNTQSVNNTVITESTATASAIEETSDQEGSGQERSDAEASGQADETTPIEVESTPAVPTTTPEQHDASNTEKSKSSEQQKIEIKVYYSSLDDKKTNGIRNIKLKNSFTALAGQSPEVNRLILEIHDNEQDIVCASNNELEGGSCYDIHVGSISILDSKGEFRTRPFFMVLARTRLGDGLETDFEATYYKLPQLTSDTPTSDNPFEGEGGTFKIAEKFKWIGCPSDFNLVFSFGARTSPSAEHREKDISPFGYLGGEREVAFDSARGVAGVGFAKDDFWKYTEQGVSGTADVKRDYSKRAILYGSLAMNKSGSVILSAYMDFNVKGDGPGEVGIALTFGGKWDSLLANLGNL